MFEEADLMTAYKTYAESADNNSGDAAEITAWASAVSANVFQLEFATSTAANISDVWGTSDGFLICMNNPDKDYGICFHSNAADEHTYSINNTQWNKMVNVHYQFTDSALSAGYDVISDQWIDPIVSDDASNGETSEFGLSLWDSSYQCYATAGGDNTWKDSTCYLYMTCSYGAGTDCIFNTSDTYNIFFLSGGYNASAYTDAEYEKMCISQTGISLQAMATDGSVMSIVSGFALALYSVFAF
jgi:hypothetical protein